MSRPVLAPLALALSALLIVPMLQAEPTAPLFVVEQQRSALVSRLAKQWADAFAVLPKERRLDHEQLSSALFALRADRLFAVTLAGDAEAIEAVLADAKREAVKPRVVAKALGDATADLTYTPINPCRILDTRATVAGPLAPNVARTFDGYSTSFATQGGTGSSCGIPNGVAALAMNVYAVNPTNLGFIKVWPADQAEPDVSTVNYQVGITAIATGALVPVDAANSNQFTAKSPAAVDFIADVVGFFKPPGDATGLDIKVAGQRVMRFEYSAISPNVIGGHPANSTVPGGLGATIGGGGHAGISCFEPSTGTFGRSCANRAWEFGTVGGGFSNAATGTASTVGGGRENTASGNWGSVIAGGYANTASGQMTTVAGGWSNKASADNGTVSGGYINTASGVGSTVVGGSTNTASGNFSMVAGGRENTATGAYAFAAGRRARAAWQGNFIWADSQDFDFQPPYADFFGVRATGGVGFTVAINGATGAAAQYCNLMPGVVGWQCTSDRHTKENLEQSNGIAVLERLVAMPLYVWNFKGSDPTIRNLGPMAQDFFAAFALGKDDTVIASGNLTGVALAAIQGLNAKLVEKYGEINSLKGEVAELKRAVEVLLTRTSPEGRVAEQR